MASRYGKNDYNWPARFQNERYDVPDEFLSDRARALIAMAERPKRVMVVEDEGKLAPQVLDSPDSATQRRKD